ncbi:MAG: hypothetical protein ACT4PQ_03650 [Betaproteobacteria bacterium]
MNTSFVRFVLRCSVIVASSMVLMLALMEVGTADEPAGACASISDHYAKASLLQSAVRPLAIIARFCDS